MEEEETSVLPGPKVSVENFLSRLPASVVKGGRVLDVRAGVAKVYMHVNNDIPISTIQHFKQKWYPSLTNITKSLIFCENLAHIIMLIHFGEASS